MGQKEKEQIQIESVFQINNTKEQTDQDQNLMALVIWIYFELLVHLVYLLLRGFLIAVPLDTQRYMFNPLLVFQVFYEIFISGCYLIGYFRFQLPQDTKKYFLLYSPMSLFDSAYFIFLILWYNLLIPKAIFIIVAFVTSLVPVLLSYLIKNEIYQFHT